MSEKKNKVWQLGKKNVVPICDKCYNLLKNKDIFKYIGDQKYAGLRSEHEYRYNWRDQNYCFFCDICNTIKLEEAEEE